MSGGGGSPDMFVALEVLQKGSKPLRKCVRALGEQTFAFLKSEAQLDENAEVRVEAFIGGGWCEMEAGFPLHALGESRRVRLTVKSLKAPPLRADEVTEKLMQAVNAQQPLPALDNPQKRGWIRLRNTLVNDYPSTWGAGDRPAAGAIYATVARTVHGLEGLDLGKAPALLRYKGFNLAKATNHPPPKMSLELMDEGAHALRGIVDNSMFTAKCADLAKDVAELFAALLAKADDLRVQRKRNEARRVAAPVQSALDSTQHIAQAGTGKPIAELENALLQAGWGDPVDAAPFLPEDRRRRSVALEALGSQWHLAVQVFRPGGQARAQVIVARVDVREDEAAVQRVFRALLLEAKTYHSRAQRREMLDVMQERTSCSPRELQVLYRKLTRDRSALETEAQAAEFERWESSLHDFTEEESVALLMEGALTPPEPRKTKFDVFWAVLHSVMTEHGLVVADRRDNDISRPSEDCPVSSAAELYERACERVTTCMTESATEPPIPSYRWFHYQLWPGCAGSVVSLKYTGMFKVTWRKQSRTLRKAHPDGRYCEILQQMLQDYAVVQVMQGKIAVSLCLDDKAVIPFGPVDLPVQSVLRQRPVPQPKDAPPTAVAADHDNWVLGAIASVTLDVEIPASWEEAVERGHYHGSACVTVKERVWSGSTALRHAAELLASLRARPGGTPEILLMETDGGGDHNCASWSVRATLAAVFSLLRLKSLIVMRTCPGRSYRDRAERVMSGLNLALSGQAFARTPLPDDIAEKQMANANCLADVRELAEKDPRLRTMIDECMHAPLERTKERLGRAKYDGNRVVVRDEVVEAEMEEIRGLLKDEFDLESWRVTREQARSNKKFMDWWGSRCAMENPYVFQLVGEGEDVLRVPFPVLTPDGQWMSLRAMLGAGGDLGKEDADRPTLKHAAEGKERCPHINKQNIFRTITCTLCSKPRALYRQSAALQKKNKNLLEEYLAEVTYSCGDSLFDAAKDGQHPQLAEVFGVRERVSCITPVTWDLWSHSRGRWCAHCGVETEAAAPLATRLKFKQVQKVCSKCSAAGLKPPAKMEVNLQTLAGRDYRQRVLDDAMAEEKNKEEEKNTDNDEEKNTDNDEEKNTDNDEEKNTDNDEEKNTDNDEEKNTNNDEEKEAEKNDTPPASPVATPTTPPVAPNKRGRSLSPVGSPPKRARVSPPPAPVTQAPLSLMERHRLQCSQRR